MQSNSVEITSSYMQSNSVEITSICKVTLLKLLVYAK